MKRLGNFVIDDSIEGATATVKKQAGPLFTPIKNKRTFEAVCEQIRREVALGALQPGDRLPPERELAEQLGVSRTAVREALRSLERGGLIYCQQGIGGGSFICERSSVAVTQAVGDMVMLGQIPPDSVLEMRIILTDQAIRLACQRGTKEDFDAIERDIAKSELLTDKGDFSRRNSYITEFYRVLGQATHNQVMVMLLESLSELTRLILVKSGREPRKDVIDVRKRVLALLRARDSDGAAKEMREHLERLNSYLEASPGTQQ